MKTKSQVIILPDGTRQSWPQSLAYKMWLAIPGAKWQPSATLRAQSQLCADYSKHLTKQIHA